MSFAVSWDRKDLMSLAIAASCGITTIGHRQKLAPQTNDISLYYVMMISAQMAEHDFRKSHCSRPSFHCHPDPWKTTP